MHLPGAEHTCHEAPPRPQPTRIEVLHIGSNPRDLELVHMAFTDCCPVVVCRAMPNPKAAMAYLTDCAKLAARAPSIVALDLEMPGISGPEVLAFIRSQPALWNVPALIIS